MSSDSGDAVLKWLAVAVPGIFAGLGWTAASGWPLAYRVLAGIAVGIAIYAVIHFVLKAMRKYHH